MLDIMRRKKRLKAVLWLVIFALSLGMLLFFVPGQNMGVSGLDTSAASVDGDDIPMKDYYDAYRRMIEQYSNGGRNRLDPEMLKALGVNRQALDALISTRVVEYSAKRLGLAVSPQEIRDAVISSPNMQDRGQFIGVERYKALLAANNLTTTQFEDGVRQMLLAKKIRNLISDSLEVTDRELRDQFARDNIEAQVSYVTLKTEDFKKKVTATDSDVRAYFENHRDKYKVGEQRKAQYLDLSTIAVADTIQVTPKEIEDAWAKESKQDTVNASHILFEVKDPAKDAEIKAKAEAVLKRAKAGEDFAELAKQFSDDPGSKLQGGNLGSFPRGRMVKEFEDAAFSLKPGEISDLVRSQFGYHIIKVIRHDTPTLESRRKELERQVQMSKATDLLKQKSQEAQKLAEKEKDLNVIARDLKIPATVKTTAFLGRSSDPFSSGISQAMLDEMFKMKDLNTIGKVVEIPSGYALPKLIEVKPPRQSEFADVRAQVEKDYADQKALDLVKADAKSLADEATASGSFEKAAKKRGLTLKTPPAFKRDGQPDADIGLSRAFSTAAFETPVGSVSGPITMEDGKRVVVLQVKSRNQFDEAAFTKQKPELRERLLSMTRESYFQEYIRRVQDGLEKAGKIRINPNALEQVAQNRSY